MDKFIDVKTTRRSEAWCYFEFSEELTECKLFKIIPKTQQVKFFIEQSDIEVKLQYQTLLYIENINKKQTLFFYVYKYILDT